MAKRSAPYGDVPRHLDEYEKRWWVVVEARGCQRRGVVVERDGDFYAVQFGADGPFEWHSMARLKLASLSQVATMDGVGV